MPGGDRDLPCVPPLLARQSVRLVRVVSPGDALVQATVTMTTCARCHQAAVYTARRRHITMGLCLAHHRHVWAGLVADGWIVAPERAKVGV